MPVDDLWGPFDYTTLESQREGGERESARVEKEEEERARKEEEEVGYG